MVNFVHVAFAAILAAAAVAPLDAAARSAPAIQRSVAVKDAFKRSHPCPANGHTSGSCPGWQIDHREPLECGGPDTIDNMQWLTVADHKAKTVQDNIRCRQLRPSAAGK